MKVGIVANVEQQEEILSKNTNPAAQLFFAENFSGLKSFTQYEAVFFLSGEIDSTDINKFLPIPVFINEVSNTLAEKNLPFNFSRINAWPGFLKREIWEVASNNKDLAGKVLDRLGWKTVFVDDKPGFIAARIISMIINEAFYALEENLSSVEDINLAMKLGTNYPYGPFEWQNKIGLQNIYALLKQLSVTSKRYSISPLLEKHAFMLLSSK